MSIRPLRIITIKKEDRTIRENPIKKENAYKCSYCWGSNHNKRTCRKRKIDIIRGSIKCQNCESREHKTLACPTLPKDDDIESFSCDSNDIQD